MASNIKMTMYLYTIALLGVIFERQIQLQKKKIQLLFILRFAVCLKHVVFICLKLIVFIHI